MLGISILFSTGGLLRNVTAVGGTEAIRSEGAVKGVESRLEATNTIAIGGTGSVDVAANAKAKGTRPSSSPAPITTRSKASAARLDNRSRNEWQPHRAPLFAAADLHQLPGPPTVDAGLTEAADGPLDLDGNPRALSAHPSCDSSVGPTDIGAYEYVAPIPTCPPPAQLPDGGGKGCTPAPGTVLRKAKIGSDRHTFT